MATHARRATVLGRRNSDTWKTLLGEDIEYQGDTLRGGMEGEGRGLGLGNTHTSGAGYWLGTQL
jgi:hypothetical protein